MVTPALARRTWRDVEPVHTMVYFVPEAEAAYAELGVTPPMMGYFGSRAAAMGPVAADLVIATFYSFNPDLVRASVPAVWDIATRRRCWPRGSRSWTGPCGAVSATR